MAELALDAAPPSRTASAVSSSSHLSAEPVEWPPKDPDEVLDYGLDWTGRLEGDFILESEWLDRGLLGIITGWYDSTRTKVWIEGGEPDTTYFVTNRVWTARGCVMDQTVLISILKAR